MVNLTFLSQMTRSAERMTKLIRFEATGSDKDVSQICGETLDDIIRMQNDLKSMLTVLSSYEERMIMTLRFIKGYTVPQCAESMNISQRSAFYYLKRAKAKLTESFPDRITIN